MKRPVVIKRGKHLIRPMKTDIYKLTDNEETILYYRLHPVQAAKDLLNIRLNWFQRIAIRKMWNTPFVLLCFGRGASKTFLNAIFATLVGLLYPLKKILVLARDKSMSNQWLWQKIVDLSPESYQKDIQTYLTKYVTQSFPLSEFNKLCETLELNTPSPAK